MDVASQQVRGPRIILENKVLTSNDVWIRKTVHHIFFSTSTMLRKTKYLMVLLSFWDRIGQSTAFANFPVFDKLTWNIALFIYVHFVLYTALIMIYVIWGLCTATSKMMNHFLSCPKRWLCGQSRRFPFHHTMIHKLIFIVKVCDSIFSIAVILGTQ